MNVFDEAVYTFINTQGVTITYNKITLGSFDNATQTSSQTVAASSLKAYPKHVRASNHYLPNLIGKTLIMFYIRAKDLPSGISLKDNITYQGVKYLVDSYSEHVANTEVLLYKVLCIKS